MFLHWGRIGTLTGDSRIYEKRSAKTAIEFFEEKFLAQTGNEWDNRDHFKKLPGKYYMVELEGNEIIDEASNALVPAGVSIPKPVLGAAQACTLPEAVQDFVKLIFDADMMKKTMEGMNMDIQKMPLGKLSRRTINEVRSTHTHTHAHALNSRTYNTSLGLCGAHRASKPSQRRGCQQLEGRRADLRRQQSLL